jgi:hypothetical protein
MFPKTALLCGLFRRFLPSLSFRSLRKFFDGPELRDAGIYSRQQRLSLRLISLAAEPGTQS